MQKKLDEALEIIKKLGLPKAQHNERSALTLLALLNLSPEKKMERLRASDNWGYSDNGMVQKFL